MLLMSENAITLLEFNRRINVLMKDRSVQQCWVIAETSDVMVRNHCYFELVQKNPLTGETVARARAVVWANRFMYLRNSFESMTGQRFGNGLKVMVEVSANFHEQYGLSLVVTNIDPSFTLGDMARQRLEILRRLRSEGVIDLNKSLTWETFPQRIAVVSAPTAAGYGDFIDQLHKNELGVKFYTCLFPAAMQGANTVPSIIAALDRINEHIDLFDCVVIIRGGGATSELNSFDNYDLAFNVAQFPIPVIIGIGHDRDKTVLDEVGHTSVKTPTAAAEYILSEAYEVAEHIQSLNDDIVEVVKDRLDAAKQELSYYGNTIPLLAQNITTRHKSRLEKYMSMIPMWAKSRIDSATKDLEHISEKISSNCGNRISQENMRLSSIEKQIELLSPDRVLKRGYSLTFKNGTVVTDASKLASGEEVTTRLASGEIVSIIK